MRIFHIATAADWAAAQASGRYTTSTRGRTLAEEGFIHASRGDQWQGVRARFYADVDEPLVLLVIDTTALTSPVVDEPVPDSRETFPHVYGPIDAVAVVQVIPLDDGAAAATPPPAAPTSFTTLYLREVYHRITMALLVMLLVTIGAVVGGTVNDTWAPLTGAAVGAVLGLVGAVALHRRRRASGVADALRSPG